MIPLRSLLTSLCSKLSSWTFQTTTENERKLERVCISDMSTVVSAYLLKVKTSIEVFSRTPVCLFRSNTNIAAHGNFIHG